MFTDNGSFLSSVILARQTVDSWDSYPYNIPAIRNLTELPLHPNVTYFIGENGTGKSTLLEAVAVSMGFNPEGGGKNLRFTTRNSHSELCNHVVLKKGVRHPTDGYFLRAESFFNVATNIESIDNHPDNVNNNSGLPVGYAYGKRSLHEQSHGESFFSLMLNRFVGNGLYLMDEPETALSPAKQMSLVSMIHNLVNLHSQFVIVTHSPIVMAYPNSKIYLFSTDSISSIAYEETEHYLVTRDFINRREQMLNILLSK